MAFGMPETRLSRQSIAQIQRKHGHLDILVFGMPKIFRFSFCKENVTKTGRRRVVPARKQTKAPPVMADADIAIVRIAPETSFKNKAYEALKEAILKMDIFV